MITISSSDPFRQRLTEQARKLQNSAERWSESQSGLIAADRYLDSAERQFQQAWNPQRQASFDNERTDSSWHGRDLQRLFRQGSVETDRSEAETRRVGGHLGALQSEVGRSDRELDGLIADMRSANDPRVPLLLQAAQDVDRAQDGFQGASGGVNRFESSGRWVDQAAWRADSPIYAIMGDRPGVNVSPHAHQVGQAIREIEREMQTMNWALIDAQRSGDQGESHLRGAADKLSQAAESPR